METLAPEIRTSKTIAPEDIRVGDHVAVLRVSYEFLSYLWCFDTTAEKSEPVRVTFLPHCDIGQPLKVLATCLPFVVVLNSNDGKFAVDVRACQLGRLHDEYVKAMKPEKKKKKKRKKAK